MRDNYLRLLLFSIIILTIIPASLFAYSGGSGEPNNPFQIASKQDLLALATDTNNYGKSFILTADVNMQGQIFTTAIIAPDTSSSNGFQGTAFTGTFDGNGHKVINFIINGGNNEYIGLFGKTNSGGSVKNLGLENFIVSGNYFIGGLVGKNDNGSINGCYSMGQVSGYSDILYSGYVGGLVGENDNGIIINCYSISMVSGYSDVGGLTGHNDYGSISKCYSYGTVDGSSGYENFGGLVGQNWSGNISDCYSIDSVSGSSNVGGLIGANYDGSISNCFATGAVNGGSNAIGGLVGYSNGNIINCYSMGQTSGSQYVGGLAGLIGNSSISNCYSTSTVSGYTDVGGLVGYNTVSSINNCYSAGSVRSDYGVGGLVGFNQGGSINNSFWDIQISDQNNSDGGTGKTTTDMKTLSTFTSAGWDFSYTDGNSAVWFMPPDDYPILTWQISPADIYTDGQNNFRDFAILAKYWLRDDCAIYNDYCDFADLDFSGSVDIKDVIEFASYWLETGIYN